MEYGADAGRSVRLPRAGRRDARTAAERLDAQPDLQYGGRTFLAASEYLRSHRRSADPTRTRYVRAANDVAGLRALVTELTRLHRIEVRLSHGPSGHSIARHLAERRFGLFTNRIAQGVLLLPPALEDYLRGRSRQALRTNNRAAVTEGITCSPIERGSIESTFKSWPERDVVARGLAPRYEEWVLQAPEDARWYVALDAAGSPLAVTVVSIDTEWALLCGMVSVSHPARWLLHTYVVEQLYAAGVSNLCVHSSQALLLAPNLQYLQQRLGYRVAHLRLTSRH